MGRPATHTPEKNIQKTTCRKINLALSRLQPVPGIEFASEAVVKKAPEVRDGTCTAMALQFADHIQTYIRPDGSLPFERRQVRRSFLRRMPDHCIRPTSEMVAEQFAYNTISVRDRSGDVSQKKMLSLVGSVSPEMHIDSLSEEDLEDVLDVMPDDGIHFVPMIEPSENDKMEESGHSMIYVKIHDIELFYDPNYGLFDLSEEDSAPFIHKIFRINQQKFDVVCPRFYQLLHSERMPVEEFV